MFTNDVTVTFILLKPDELWMVKFSNKDNKCTLNHII